MILVDTNILIRIADPASPNCIPCRHAMKTLRQRGEQLFLAPQVLYEFWVAATKPKKVNGLGMTANAAEQWLNYACRLIPVAAENDRVLPLWRDLMQTHKITGFRAHDVRLVAMMNLYGMTHLLTLNPDDFKHFPITLLDPTSL